MMCFFHGIVPYNMKEFHCFSHFSGVGCSDLNIAR